MTVGLCSGSAEPHPDQSASPPTRVPSLPRRPSAARASAGWHRNAHLQPRWGRRQTEGCQSWGPSPHPLAASVGQNSTREDTRLCHQWDWQQVINQWTEGGPDRKKKSPEREETLSRPRPWRVHVLFRLGWKRNEAIEMEPNWSAVVMLLIAERFSRRSKSSWRKIQDLTKKNSTAGCLSHSQIRL